MGLEGTPCHNGYNIIVDCMRCRYGQLSGMVEPLAGIFGAAAVVVSIICVPVYFAMHN